MPVQGLMRCFLGTWSGGSVKRAAEEEWEEAMEEWEWEVSRVGGGGGGGLCEMEGEGEKRLQGWLTRQIGYCLGEGPGGGWVGDWARAKGGGGGGGGKGTRMGGGRGGLESRGSGGRGRGREGRNGKGEVGAR